MKKYLAVIVLGLVLSGLVFEMTKPQPTNGAVAYDTAMAIIRKFGG
jgi:hypothetical protein